MRHPDPLISTSRLLEATATLSANADVELPLYLDKDATFTNPYSNEFDSFILDNFIISERDAICELYKARTDFYNKLYTVNSFYSINTTSGLFRGNEKIQKLCAAFQIEIQNLIPLSNSYVYNLERFKKLTLDTLNKDVHKHIKACINLFLKILQSQAFCASMPQAKEVLQQYKILISNIFNANGKILDFSQAYKALNPQIINISRFIFKEGGDILSESNVVSLINETSKIYILMKIQRDLLTDLPNIMHNFENALLDLRISIHSLSESPNFISYFKNSRELIQIQIDLLSYFQATKVNPVIKLWPFLNIDLQRSQSKAIQLSPSTIISLKKSDLARLSEIAAKELMPFAEVITICSAPEITSKELALLIKFINLDVIKQNALIEFLALERIVFHYTISISRDQSRSERENNIEAQFKYLTAIVENLQATKALWNGILFKNINEFVYMQKRLQNVIAGIELLFLNCENLFRSASINNLDSKNAIIQKQLQLLKMQDELLNFSQESCGEDFVSIFYFRKPYQSGFIFYEVSDRNRVRAKKGDHHNIILGIPITSILSRNAIFWLRLEALKLEFLAEQRMPQDNDYYQAISDSEIEQYLAQWETEAEKERELKHQAEELENKTLKKKQERLQKLAAKKVEKAATKPKELTKYIILGAPTSKPAPEQSKDKLVQMLNNLLSKLHPRSFNSEAIQQVISELYPLTQSSSNKEVVFQALSAMGDSYSMIAGHYLNSTKHPKQLIVNLKLAINYYRQAELTLRKLDCISQDQHMHYYTWLYHSICIQQRLLDQYMIKFSRLRSKLWNERERVKQKNPKKWEENCHQEGWHESDKTKNRIALEEALEAVNLMQRESAELVKRTKDKTIESDSDITYIFENYLHAAGKVQVPEPALDYRLNECEVTDTFMSDTKVEKPSKAVTSKKLNPHAKLVNKPRTHSKETATVVKIRFSTKLPTFLTPDLASTAAHHHYTNSTPIVVFTRPAKHELCIASQISSTINILVKEILNTLELFLEFAKQKTPAELINSIYFKPVNEAVTIARVFMHDFNASDLSAFLEKLAKIISSTNGFDNWLLRNQYFPDECLKIV